uniref:Uncharacterized protein n=1 Tax=Sus scrofa TaxID=9823 RepID=A0A8D1WID3_PIG
MSQAGSGPHASAPSLQLTQSSELSKPSCFFPRKRSTFQTFGNEVCLIGHSMCPVPSTVHRESICCECHTRFGGHLPVPRAEAALPYWVPLSLRPQKQVNKTWFSSVSLPQGGSGPHVQFIKCLMSGLRGPGPSIPEALSAS